MLIFIFSSIIFSLLFFQFWKFLISYSSQQAERYIPFADNSLCMMWIKRVRIKRCSRRLFKSIKSIAFMRELIVCASSATTTIIAFWKQRKKRRLKNIWFHSFSVPSTHHVYPTWMYNVCDAILNNKMNQCWISWIYYHRIASILFATWKCIFSALSAVCDAFSNIKTWLYHRRTLHTKIKFSSCTRCSTREFKEEKNFHQPEKLSFIWLYDRANSERLQIWWVGAETYSRDQIRCE